MKASVEVRDTILRLYEAMGTGDVGAIERLFTRHGGVRAIGSDPEEWWQGHDAIVQAFDEQLRATGTRKVVPGELEAFAEGTVGWAADRRTHRRSNGQVLTIRETFVLHKEDGEWKIVQFHASVALSNAEMLAGGVPEK